MNDFEYAQMREDVEKIVKLEGDLKNAELRNDYLKNDMEKVKNLALELQEIIDTMPPVPLETGDKIKIQGIINQLISIWGGKEQ